jgi:tRNA-dihydrouridine synthase B
MAGITDRAYRTFLRQLGAPTVVTELISADSYVHGNKLTREMLTLTPEEGPCGIQIFGAIPNNMAEIAKIAEKNGAAFVDINFGCPVPKVTKSGAGSGALLNLVKMREVIRSVRQAVNIPLSIKSRLGWDSTHIVADQVSQIAHEEGVNWFVLHARTREQAYKGQNNWEYTEQLAQDSPCPIVGNGDIYSAEHANHILKHQKVSGIMIGRAALANPCIFAQMQNQDFVLPTIYELLLQFHDITLRATHEKVQAVRFKKCAIWMSYGKPHSHAFRSQLLQEAQTLGQALKLSLEYFQPEDRPTSPNDLTFLKGGHG